MKICYFFFCYLGDSEKEQCVWGRHYFVAIVAIVFIYV